MAKTPERLAREKTLAGAAAAQWVSPEAKLGIGSGSTVQAFIHALAARARSEGWTPHFVAASKESADHAIANGFQPLQAGTGLRFDLVVDGADEIGPGLNLIKGGGGALLHEKILASAADRLLIIGDSSKLVATLGRFPLPVEVVPFAAFAIETRLATLGLKPIRRPSKPDPTQPFVTEEGNWIYDCATGPLPDPSALATTLERLPGLVEHGLFLGMAAMALVADGDQVIIYRAAECWPSSAPEKRSGESTA
jgi:ribose 5-phosphate isomerase A